MNKTPAMRARFLSALLGPSGLHRLTRSARKST
jgi:hypothetical protein